MASENPLIIRAIWFLLVGWWLTGIWLSIAWFLNLLVVTIPLGIKMINQVPFVLSLKSRSNNISVNDEGERIVESLSQVNIVVRAAWFLLVGWWLSFIWMFIGYLFTLSILGLPIAIWMYGKLPFVVSLYNY